MIFREQIVRNLILLCCCGTTCYFTIDQFVEYFKNEDTSVLSYRKHVFDSESHDQYPTYTVCFKGLFASISSIERSSTDLENFLTFTRCGQKCTSYDPRCYVACSRPKDIPLKKSFHFPDKLCFSMYFQSGTKVKEFETRAEKVIVDVQTLLDLQLDVGVYVHRGGQLMRHILTTNSPEIVAFDPWDRESFYMKNKSQTFEMTISIGDVIVLRRRENGKQKCNATLFDEDQKWREEVVHQIGCIPLFWISFFENLTINGNCTEDQLKLYENYGNNPYLYKNISKLYLNPCDEMQSRVQIDRKWYHSNKNLMKLNFKFASTRYLEILNYKAYSGESLLGQVGGYIGKQKSI